MQIRKLPKKDFPKALLEIPQPPEDLWIIGDLPTNENLIYLCVVGSRKFTSYGREACEKIIGGLKGYPIIIVSGFTIGFIRHLAGVVKDKSNFRLLNKWLWSIFTIIMVVLLLLFKNISIYWLAFSIIYLFAFDETLRLPLGWAGVSLLSFLSVSYYHDGYLLEAGFPLSLALGTIFTNIMAPYMPPFLTIKEKISRKELILIVSCVLIGCFAVIGIGSRTNILRDKFEVIKVAVDSNRNFKKLMDYLQQKIPQNAIIYELSEEEIGTTLFDRRFFPLKERALRAKIMNIEDTLVMLKVLNRADILLHPSSGLDLSTHDGEEYFIALNNFERKIAEDKFQLELIEEFKADYDSAAIYRIKKIGDGDGENNRMVIN